jgi:proprotein convertase subtilisin/kexin type 5
MTPYNTEGHTGSLHNGVCGACPTGYFSVDSKCIECDGSCKECSGTSTTCTACATDAEQLVNGECITVCTDGEYRDVSDGTIVNLVVNAEFSRIFTDKFEPGGVDEVTGLHAQRTEETRQGMLNALTAKLQAVDSSTLIDGANTDTTPVVSVVLTVLSDQDLSLKYSIAVDQAFYETIEAILTQISTPDGSKNSPLKQALALQNSNFENAKAEDSIGSGPGFSVETAIKGTMCAACSSSCDTCNGGGTSDCTSCTVRVFRQKFTLEDAIGSHACSLEANMHVTNGIPLGRPLFLPVHTVNCVQTLKALVKT